MRARPSARLLVLDSQDRLLLFRFVHRAGALAGKAYWATPGGGLEPGESFAQAAMRELAEETGLRIADVGPEVGRREFALTLPSGEVTWADERFFLVRTEGLTLSRDGWTAEENAVMRESRWWPLGELAATAATVHPEGLADLVRGATQ